MIESTPNDRGIFPADLLSRCISCGFCLPVCPTYLLTGDEKSSPRGRINLMRALETGVLAEDDPTLIEESSFCLGCRACEPVCPAGVQYGTLLEHWRDHQWSGRRRPVLIRALTAILATTWLLRLPRLVRRYARTKPGPGPHLMLGCAERSLFPAVSRAALVLCPELDSQDKQGCCGALHAHNGDLEQGRALARTLGEHLPGTIVTTSGGCAAHLSDVIGRERVKEISEYLLERKDRVPGAVMIDGRRARVTLQDSCHLRNGLGIWREPRALLAEIADYVELPDAEGCCGAAGSYSLLRRKDSQRVLGPKLDAIEDLGVDYIVAVNPGCLRQLQVGLRSRRSRISVIHIAEFMALSATDHPEPLPVAD
jgi:glycolate oxidase iron-sulfur subunit